MCPKIGAGVVAYSRSELNAIILDFLEHPQKPEQMRRAAAGAVPGQAAGRAVELMLRLVQ